MSEIIDRDMTRHGMLGAYGDSTAPFVFLDGIETAIGFPFEINSMRVLPGQLKHSTWLTVACLRLARRKRSIDGFSMVESLLAVSITTIAGAALLTSIGAAVRASSDATHRAVARGLAAQMMDEIAAVRFPPLVANGQTMLNGSTTRDQFADIDDYDGWSASPPVDRSGRPLGYEATDSSGTQIPRPAAMRPDERFLRQFTRKVVVERVVAGSVSGWQVTTGETGYRRVTVRVAFSNGSASSSVLSEVTRIFSYVPVAP